MKLIQVDAFTEKPFRGNPAAVCLLDRVRPDDWMQNVAMEMNLSETAFLLEETPGYRLRWFTPATEVSLCGHATLASSHVLWEERLLATEQEAVFLTRSGKLAARRVEEWIEMDFPRYPVETCEPPTGIVKCLGIWTKLSNRCVLDEYSTYLFELDSEDHVREISPDFGAR